ncbi:MAG: hypothetical protein PHP92_05650 [Candidatus Nanoarchaeia archaeon]|jgi:hypothetical protein|nr:hypothetical protein [Candidatus Nanoarchaeia archaeon]
MSTALFIILLSFKGGIIPVENIYYANSYFKQHEINLENSYFAEFKIEAMLFDFIFARGSMKNVFNACLDSVEFAPDHDEYIFSCGLRFQEFEIGFLHKCYHPIHPYQFTTMQVENIIEGGYEEIYFQFNSKIEF